MQPCFMKGVLNMTPFKTLHLSVKSCTTIWYRESVLETTGQLCLVNCGSLRLYNPIVFAEESLFSVKLKCSQIQQHQKERIQVFFSFERAFVHCIWIFKSFCGKRNITLLPLPFCHRMYSIYLNFMLFLWFPGWYRILWWWALKKKNKPQKPPRHIYLSSVLAIRHATETLKLLLT